MSTVTVPYMPRAGRLLSRGLRATPVTMLVASAVLALHAGLALLGPLVTPYDPVTVMSGGTLAQPSATHWLGTDGFGRDVFSRLVAGERAMLLQAMSTSGLAVAVGSLLGITAAYVRGWYDALLMRLMELVLSFPALIVGMLLLTAVGSSRVAVVGVVATLFAAPVTMVVRSAALGVVAEDYVTAARLRGEPRLTVAWREVLPNILPVVFVEFSLRSGYAAILIGSLGFLGFGASPPAPDWGLMINEGRTYLAASPWPVLAPALALGSLVVALSLVTEGVSDALSPRGIDRKVSR